MSARFNVLRLETCLAGEAFETKRLEYSKVAFEASKSRPLRKYGRDPRREIQSHSDNSIKLKPIR